MTHERFSPDIERLTFGQPAENIAASDRNPIKHGIFIRYVGYSMAEYATASGVHSTPADNLRASQPATPTGGERSSAGIEQRFSPGREYRQKFIDRAQAFVDKNSVSYGRGKNIVKGHTDDAKLMIDMIALVNSLDAALEVSYSMRDDAQPPAQSKAEWFCEWLQGYLTPITGQDELDAFDANTIHNTLNETMGPPAISSTICEGQASPEHEKWADGVVPPSITSPERQP